MRGSVVGLGRAAFHRVGLAKIVIALAAAGLAALIGFGDGSALAQTAPQSSGDGQPLPPVTVEAPQRKPATAKITPTAKPGDRIARVRADRRPQIPQTATTQGPPRVNAQGGQSPFGPGVGFVATRSATATKTDTPIVETPQSISVVTRDQLEAQQVWTAKEALRYTAGVVPETRANFGAFDIIYNRGFVVDRYLDGMRLQGNTGFVTPQVDLFGMERVELLRGPASVLFGQGSPGGLINMVSKRPTAVPFGDIEVQTGNYNRFQGAFDVGGPIDKEGKFEYRLTGDAHQADNQVNFVREQHEFIAPAFTWRPDYDTSLTVLMNYQRDPQAGYYNFVPSVGSVVANPLGKIPTSFYTGDPNLNLIDRTQYAAGYLLEHRFDNVWTVRQNLRYQDTTGHLNQVLPFVDGLEADNQTLDRYAQADSEHIGAFTIDNQIQAKFATGWLQHTALAGLDYQHTLFNQDLVQGGAPSINIFNPTYFQTIPFPVAGPDTLASNTHQLVDQVGAYAQDQLRLGNFILVLGGRHDWANSNTDTDNNTFGVVSSTATPQRDQANTGRIGGVYLFDSGLAPYAVYATSFQPQVGTEFLGNPFKPTTGQLYEAGVKYQPNGWNAIITTSVYDLTQQNVTTPDPVNTGFLTQTGEIRSRGFEFEGKLSVTKRLDLIGTYTYIDARVTQSNDVDLGKVPLWIPHNVASIWGDYTIREGALNGFGLGLGVRYIGESFGNPANTLVIPAYTLVDAALHYDLSHFGPRWRGVELQVNASNLFDTTYVSECTSTNCVYGLRRKVLGTLRYRW